MKLSISNIAWDAQDDDKLYEKMKYYGYTGLEIAPTRIFVDKPYEKIEAAHEWHATLQSKYNFVVSSMQSIWFGKNELIFADNLQRQILLDYTKQAICFASAIQCKNLVFGNPRNRVIPDNTNSQLWESGVAFFRQLGLYAKEHNTVIGMEANLTIYHTNYINTTSQAIDLIEEVGVDGFLLNLDIGAMIENKECVEILERHAKLINHVHVSEPFLQSICMHDERRAFHSELAAFLRENHYQGYVSIEMAKTKDYSMLDECLAYVKEMFG